MPEWFGQRQLAPGEPRVLVVGALEAEPPVAAEAMALEDRTRQRMQDAVASRSV